jgi:hypothetical protein
VTPGLLLAASGLGWLSTLTATSSYAGTALPAELLVGAGMGLVFTPAISVATAGVDPRFAGVAAATANTAMQVGGSVGTAVLNTVAVSATSRYAATHGLSASALVHGSTAATTCSAATLVAGALAVALLVRTPRPERNS